MIEEVTVPQWWQEASDKFDAWLNAQPLEVSEEMTLLEQIDVYAKAETC